MNFHGLEIIKMYNESEELKTMDYKKVQKWVNQYNKLQEEKDFYPLIQRLVDEEVSNKVDEISMKQGELIHFITKYSKLNN